MLRSRPKPAGRLILTICSCPYEEMMEQVKACSSTLYHVADGKKETVERAAQSIPMIAY